MRVKVPGEQTPHTPINLIDRTFSQSDLCEVSQAVLMRCFAGLFQNFAGFYFLDLLPNDFIDDFLTTAA